MRVYFDLLFFFFNDTATTEIYTLSLHDALPIFEPIRRCSKNIRRRDATAGHEPFRHRRRYWAAYARAQYSCQARALSSQAFRIWSCTFIRCVTASETRKATPRMPTPQAVLNVGEPDRWPVAIAHAVRIALTMTNVTEPAIRRVIQPITQPVALSCNKGYGTKITYANFRQAGAVARTNFGRVP